MNSTIIFVSVVSFSIIGAACLAARARWRYWATGSIRMAPYGFGAWLAEVTALAVIAGMLCAAVVS